MIDVVDMINFSFAVTGIFLTILGLVFVYLIKYIDKVTKNFFTVFFSILLCYVISDIISQISLVILNGRFVAMSEAGVFLESFFSSLLILFLEHYILYLRKISWEKSKGIKIIYTSEFVYLFLLILTQFTTEIYYFDESGIYHRGPLYPILLAPTIISMTTILITVIQNRSKLTKRQSRALLLYVIIPAVAMIVQMFMFGFLFIVIGTVIAAIIFFVTILHEQINDHVHQKQLNDIYQTDILQLQMRPHFIYNTMSSIYYLCTLDPQKAQMVVRDFSIYLKKNFSAISKRELIPFEDALEHTRAYLAIEKVRYEKLLFVEYDIQNTDFQLPPLIIQPLVENAVKHGVDPDFPALYIWIRTFKEDDKNVIVVENTGPDFTPVSGSDKDVHVGITNVRKRLELMCGGALKIAPRAEGGTVVRIEIP